MVRQSKAVRRFQRQISAWALLIATISGCHTTPTSPDRSTVSNELTSRFGQAIQCSSRLGEMSLPPGVSLEVGLTEDGAIGIALWNNAAFQELLADLGIARGDLIQAGLLPNPEFAFFFGASDKPFKYAFELPIEALWLRPIRVHTAYHDARRASERLTQAGLDLIRDVRLSYADTVLAKERLRVANEGVKLRMQIAELAQKRLDAGEFSKQDAAAAQVDLLQAQQDKARVEFEVPIAEERLRNLLGIGAYREPLKLDPLPLPSCPSLDVDSLTQEAMGNRPDALAAKEAVAAAEARVDFACKSWVRIFGIADASSGKNGHEFGPALRFTVPLFNWNQGGIARAEAEWERACRNRTTVHNQIILDVQRAHLQHRQARAEMDVLKSKVRPEVETAIRRAQSALQEGSVSYVIVLETTRQLLDNYLREAILQGDLRRAWAELERSVGRKLSSTNNRPPAPIPSAGSPEGAKVK